MIDFFKNNDKFNVVLQIEGGSMQFAVIRLGEDRATSSNRESLKYIIDTTLRRFLAQHDWEITGLVFTEDIGILLSLKGSSSGSLEELIEEFENFIGKRWHSRKTDPEHQELLEAFPGLKDATADQVSGLYALGRDIHVEILMDSTETDGQIFAQIVLRAQLEAVDNKISEVKESLEEIGEMFES